MTCGLLERKLKGKRVVNTHRMQLFDDSESKVDAVSAFITEHLNQDTPVICFMTASAPSLTVERADAPASRTSVVSISVAGWSAVTVTFLSYPSVPRRDRS